MQLLTDIIKIVMLLVILVLSLATVLFIPRVKETKNNTVKTLLYIFLGMVVFALAGLTYSFKPEYDVNGTIIVRNIIDPYIQFFPIFIYSISLIAATLVTYMDKDKYGYIIAGTGFAVLLPELLSYILNGRYDLILLGGALWALIPIIWVTMWKSKVFEPLKLKDKFFISLKAAILTYPIYLLTALVSVFGETSGLSFDVNVLKSPTLFGDIGLFILGTLWLYLLITVIIVTMMFIIHDLALHTFNIKREITAKNEIRYYREEEKEEKPPEPKPDAFKGLLNEMQIFHKYIDRVDRIRAASTIARFKNEYQTIAVRHSDGSKAETEQFIKFLEQEFKKKY